MQIYGQEATTSKHRMGPFPAVELWRILTLFTILQSQVACWYPPMSFVSSASILHPTPAANGCYSYGTLSEYNRKDSYGSSGYCDAYLHGWYRFSGAAGDRLSQTCQTGSYSGCASHYRGWMIGSLPNYYEGMVRRTVYFADRYGSCYSRSTIIWVQKCSGGYYVYYFQRNVFSCNYRYCGSGYQGSIAPSPSTTLSVPSSSVAPSPLTSGCYSYSTLSEYNRKDTYGSSGYCDSYLLGWYRFNGAAGDRLSQTCQTYSYRGCASYYNGWMSGSLPTYYEGVVRRTVYFAERGGSCYSRSTIIWVQNCGGYYVYYFQRNALSCNYRYCGSSYQSSITPSPSITSALPASSVAPSPLWSGCYSYSTLSEYNRKDSYGSSGYCDSYLHGWYRFGGAAGDRLSQTCQTQHYYGCASYYNGWMSGSLPNYYEGMVRRTVYFADRYGSCYSRSTVIWVQNCGSYYVYYFQRNALSCNYRYCGTSYQSSIAPSPPTSPVLSSSVAPSPLTSGCYSYGTLNEYTRRDTYGSSGHCDYYLHGWYRFSGAAGERLSQMCQTHYYSGCASYYRGWMSRSLPNYHEGMVRRAVYFAERGGSCYSRSTTIWVQNCGSYYVYYFQRYALSCNYRYCGSGYQSSIAPSPSTTSSVLASSVSPSPHGNGCYSYSTLGEYNRKDSYGSSGYCDYYLHGWYRFSGAAGDRLSQTCQTGYYSGCASYYRGWMSGSLPNYYEGMVRRTVYFAERGGSCYSRSTIIWVQNCGSYYVYYFQRNVFSCNYRYCGSGYQSSIAPSPSSTSSVLVSSVAPSPHGSGCYSYSTLSEYNRKDSYGSSGYCDAYLHGWYRFSGAAGDRLSQTCQTGYYYGCASYYNGWMNGSLPHYYEGMVRRTVYFAQRFGSCYSRSTIIWVQNCGGYYVYYFQRNVFSCNYRYCGSGYQSSIAPSQSSTRALVATSSFLPQNATPTTQHYDACDHYQILTDPTRAHSYRDWYTNKCDNQLYGWYRFMGQAGNRMQYSCSSGVSGYYRCGSMYQGWLLQSHPRIHEGEVYRTVCFSRHSSCYCQYQKTIKVKNCGSFYVYWLDGTPTCSLRYCGAKDSMTRVSCGSNYMRIDLYRQYFNASRYETITLRDRACRASYSTGLITLGSVPMYCGGTRRETQKYIIYTNDVILTAKQNADMVTRDHDEIIQFSCRYDRNGYTSGTSFLPISRISGNESSIGSFTFNFEMFKSKQYTYRFYSYPVKVQLRDYLYFQAVASTVDSSLVLLVDQCYSTPTMNRNHHSKYIFINNGCPIDKTVRFHSTDKYQQQFSIQAFRYLNNQSTVFIHCLVFLCQNTSADSRCTSGCPGNNIHRSRAKREISNAFMDPDEEVSHSQYYLLEAGPIVLGKGKSSTDKQGEDNSNRTLMITVIALVVGVVGLIVIVAVLLLRMRLAKTTEVKLEVKELGIDNALDDTEHVNHDEEDEKNRESVI